MTNLFSESLDDDQSNSNTGGWSMTAIDSHTCGQQTRVIVEGLPSLTGSNLHEKRSRLASKYDVIRQVAALEPRGHVSMFVAALVSATDPSCEYGVIFMDAAGYHDMCGHAIIGVATTLVSLGYIETQRDEARFALETPVGPIMIRAQVEAGRVKSVAFRNQTAYYQESVRISTPSGATTKAKIAYGGQWYAFVDASDFGLRIEPSQIDDLTKAAQQVRAEIADAISHPDPATGIVPSVSNIAWYDRPSTRGAHARNVPINEAGGFDRSPCGTATSARMAILNAEGLLRAGQIFVNQGLLGTVYRGRIVDTTDIKGHPAIVPEIEGSAWLTGRYEIWVDETDPLRHGFLIG